MSEDQNKEAHNFPTNSWNNLQPNQDISSLEKTGKAGIGEDRQIGVKKGTNGHNTSDSEDDLYDTGSIPSTAVKKKKITSNLTTSNVEGENEAPPKAKMELPEGVRRQIKPFAVACQKFLDDAMVEADFHKSATPTDIMPEGCAIGTTTQAVNYFTTAFSSYKLKEAMTQVAYPSHYDITEEIESEFVEFFTPVVGVMFNTLLACSALSSFGQIPLQVVEVDQPEEHTKKAAVPDAPEEEEDVVPGAEAQVEEKPLQVPGLEEDLLPLSNALFKAVQTRWTKVRSVLLEQDEAKALYLKLKLKLGAWHQDHCVRKWPKNLYITEKAPRSVYVYRKPSVYENIYSFTENFAAHHMASWLLTIFAPLQHCLNAPSVEERDAMIHQLATLPSWAKVQEIRQDLLDYLPSRKAEAAMKAAGQTNTRFIPKYKECAPGAYFSIPMEWMLNWRKSHCPEDEWPPEKPTAASLAAERRKKSHAVMISAADLDEDDEVSTQPAAAAGGAAAGEEVATAGADPTQTEVAEFQQSIASLDPINFGGIYEFDKDGGAPEIKYNGESKIQMIPYRIAKTFHLAYGGGPFISHPFFLDPKKGFCVPATSTVKFAVSYEVDGVPINMDFIEAQRPMTPRHILTKLMVPYFETEESKTQFEDLMKTNSIQFEKKPRSSYSYHDEEDPIGWDEVVEFSTYHNEFKVTKVLASDETKYQRGHAGLSNLGNTCYMNAAIQCISCTTPLRHKLIGNAGGTDAENPADPNATALLKEEASGPDATDGTPMTFQFAKLLKKMWSGKKRTNDPKDFRTAVIGRFARFANYEQHDSIELVNGVLDAMHEELNPVKKKQYRERKDEDDAIPEAVLQKLFWDDYLQNNQSIFAPIFHGQLKSRLECVECHKVRVVFDAFSCLPLSIDRLEKHSFDFPVLDMDKGTEYRVRARVPLQSPVAVLKADLLRMDFMAGLGADDFEVIKQTPKGYNDWRITWATNKDEIGGRDEFWVYILRDRKKYTVPLPTPPPTPAKVAATTDEPEADAIPDAVPVDTDVKGEDDPKKDETKKENDKKEPEPQYLPFCRCFLFIMGEPKRNVYGQMDEKDLYRLCMYFDPTSNLLDFHRLLWNRLRHTIDIKKVDDKVAEDNEASAEVKEEGGDPRSEAPEDAEEMEETMLFDDFCRALTLEVRTHMNYGYASRWQAVSLDSPNASKPVHDQPHSFDKGSFSEYKLTLSGTQMTFKNISADPVMDSTLQSVPENKDVKSDATLDKCFQRASNSHIVDDQVYCPDCKTHRDTIKEERVWVLPDVLILQYKRFQFSMATLGMKKIDTDVDFPTELDMAPYVTKECRAAENTKYTLRGVIWHSGSVSFGHYTATAWDSEGQEWVHYDDSSASGKEEAPHGGGRAYIMFYQRTKDDDPTAPRMKQKKGEEAKTAGGGPDYTLLSDDQPEPAGDGILPFLADGEGAEP